MPVGSHKDAFKAHQTVKKLVGKDGNPILANMAATILLDFVKSQRQVKADRVPDALPDDTTSYDPDKLNEALVAVEKLCGKCEESHDDGCFVNQTRRSLIAARTGVDLGIHFDGKKTLDDLLKEAEALSHSEKEKMTQPEQLSSAEAISVVKPESDGYASLLSELNELKEKDVFRHTLIDEIMHTITAVSQGDFAAEMPVHDDEQLGKLATAFNLMLKTINETMRNLDALVAERSRDLRMIMDTVPVGLLSLNEEYKIKPEYSKACETFLGVSDLRGRDFFDTIGLTRRRGEERDKLMDFLDVLKQQLLPVEDMLPLNPFKELEISVTEGRKNKWIRLNYHLIELGGGLTPHVLVVIEDITQAKAMQAEIEKSEKENLQLKAIAEDPDLFCEFLGESLKLLANSESLTMEIENADDPRPMVNEIFRGVHTIKGTSGAFGLDDVADQAAVLENALSCLRQAEKLSEKTVRDMKDALIELTRSVNQAAEKTKKLLGVDIMGGANYLRVEANEIKRNIELVRDLFIDPEAKRIILKNLKRLRALPVKKGFAKALKIIPKLLERLEKDIEFIVDDNGVLIDCDLAYELNTPLVHLIRNSFDHGIESPDERMEAGKPETGSVVLTTETNANNIIVKISDDGRGLNPDKLRKSALSKNIISQEQADSMTDREAYNLIFHPGFSTAECITDVSGRGVGMDAVRNTICIELGGSMDIESEIGKGTSVIMLIPSR